MPFDGTDFGSDAAILRAARDGIADPERWCQGRLNDGPAHCVEGWLLAVGARSDVAMRIASEHLFPALPLRQRCGVGVHSAEGRAQTVVHYQDRRRRKHAAVVAMFDRAIARLEEPCPTSR